MLFWKVNTPLIYPYKYIVLIVIAIEEREDKEKRAEENRSSQEAALKFVFVTLLK